MSALGADIISCYTLYIHIAVITVRGSDGQYCFRLSFVLCAHDNL